MSDLDFWLNFTPEEVTNIFVLLKILFSRPCWQLVGLMPNQFLLVIFALHDIPIGYQDNTLVTNVFPSCHQGHQSLPFSNQGPRFHFSIYILLKWSVTNERKTTDRTESRTISVISIDVLYSPFQISLTYICIKFREGDIFHYLSTWLVILNCLLCF